MFVQAAVIVAACIPFGFELHLGGALIGLLVMAAFCIAGFWHAKLGLQVVIEDYVHTRASEVTLQLLNIFLCSLGAIASVFAIFRIALTA